MVKAGAIKKWAKVFFSKGAGHLAVNLSIHNSFIKLMLQHNSKVGANWSMH